TFYREDASGKKTWYNPKDVRIERDDKGRVTGATLLDDGQPVVPGAKEKMSKSKNNGVDPQDLIDQYGADTVRLFTMFAAPPEQSLEWSDSGVEGAHRFLKRLWKQVHAHTAQGPAPTLDVASLNQAQKDLRRKTHETITKVSDDISRRTIFNTAIAAVMELMNQVAGFDDSSEQGRAVMQEALESAVLLLSPTVPPVSHTLWQALGHADPIIDATWPKADERAMVRDQIELVVQVNGKVRARLNVAANAEQAQIEQLALSDENVQRFTEGLTIRKVIVVRGKLVNIVAS